MIFPTMKTLTNVSIVKMYATQVVSSLMTNTMGDLLLLGQISTLPELIFLVLLHQAIWVTMRFVTYKCFGDKFLGFNHVYFDRWLFLCTYSVSILFCYLYFAPTVYLVILLCAAFLADVSHSHYVYDGKRLGLCTLVDLIMCMKDTNVVDGVSALLLRGESVYSERNVEANTHGLRFPPPPPQPDEVVDRDKKDVLTNDGFEWYDGSPPRYITRGLGLETLHDVVARVEEAVSPDYGRVLLRDDMSRRFYRGLGKVFIGKNPKHVGYGYFVAQFFITLTSITSGSAIIVVTPEKTIDPYLWRSCDGFAIYIADETVSTRLAIREGTSSVALLCGTHTREFQPGSTTRISWLEGTCDSAAASFELPMFEGFSKRLLLPGLPLLTDDGDLVGLTFDSGLPDAIGVVPTTQSLMTSVRSRSDKVVITRHLR